jgi:protocatechuate 3,4-dioxygenase beta subunit
MIRLARFLIFISTIFLAVFAAANAQMQQRDNRPRAASISGRVTVGGKPAANAKITITEAPREESNSMAPVDRAREAYNAITDADGRYRVSSLPEGKYEAQVMMGSCVREKRSPNESLIESVSLDEGESRENVDFALVRGGVITGRVTDADGRPLIARVISLQIVDEQGQKQEYRNHLEWESFQTDDRGVYRIYGLEPGADVVGINGTAPSYAGLNRTNREPPTYHPSSPRASAVEINLRAGEEMTGVDIRSRPARGRSISGTIAGETHGDGLINGVVVMLIGVGDKSVAGVTTLISSRNFSLHGVEDGEYELVAIRFSESFDFSASAPRRVTVRGADLSGIDLKLLKLGSISGRVVVERLKPESACKSADEFTVEELLIELKRDDRKPGVSDYEFLPMQTELMLGGATPDKDGGFTLKNLEAGRYWIKAGLPDENWRIRAITQAAAPKPIDVARAGVTLKQGEKLSGVEIIIAEGAASLSGKIVPASEGARLPKRLRVHLIPAETAAADDLLRYAEATVSGDGAFEFKHIAPGKYLLRTRQMPEKEANDGQVRPIAWDAIERVKLRREAIAAKNEIELQPCRRVTNHVLRW